MNVIKKLMAFFVLFFAAVAISGCNGAKSNENTAFSEDSLNGDVVAVMKAMPEDVSDYRVECRGHGKGKAKGKNKDKVCVAVCHKPPGNPTNSKTLILPLKAVVAHLNHGSDKHVDHDTLGFCDDGQGDDGDDDEGDEYSDDDEGSHDGDPNDDEDCSNAGDDDSDEGDSSDDGNSGSDDDDGMNDDDSSVEDPVCNDLPCDDSGNPIDDMGDVDDVPNVPDYCLANYEIDSDCDGLNDETGEEIY